MNTPKDWWGNSDNAKVWIEQNERRERNIKETENTTIQSQCIVLSEIDKFIKSKKGVCSILEVGSGDGRLIGNLSNNYKSTDVACYAADINTELLKHIKSIFSKVGTFYSDITTLDADDNTFDLVFTYQVLQHVDPDNINKAVQELLRVSKGEVWMWEGIGRVDGYGHGVKTHNAHNGSWVWHIDEMIDCYAVEIPKNNNIELSRQRIYKVKK